VSRRGRLAALAGALVAVAAAAFLLHGPGGAGAPGIEPVALGAAAPDWDVVIPRGTADRIAAGEDVEVIPRQVEARVGQSIRIANQDDEAHLLGPWSVGPGEVLTHRFASAGVFEGECNVHPTGRLRLVVAAA
jgi:hypothetical protein